MACYVTSATAANSFSIHNLSHDQDDIYSVVMSKVDSSDSSAEDDVSWDDTSVISIKDIATVCIPRWARVSPG